MNFLRSLAAAVALAALSLPAAAQNTPRGVQKQERADRKMDRAHTIRHGESLSKEPKLVRQDDRRDHHRAKPRR
jgi:hypothetical protein